MAPHWTAPLFVFIAGCADDTVITHQPGVDTDPCAAQVTTEVAAAEAPVDVAAIAARGGVRSAPGFWADGRSTTVTASLSVREDVVYRLTPEDPACPTTERWEVGVDVTATDEGVLDVAWAARVPASLDGTWSLGVVLDEDTAGELRAEAGYPVAAEPYASIAVTWADGVDGAVETLGTDPDEDVSLTLLTFTSAE